MKEILTIIIFILTVVMVNTTSKDKDYINNTNACYQKYRELAEKKVPLPEAIIHRVNSTGQLECKLTPDGDVSRWIVAETEQ